LPADRGGVEVGIETERSFSAAGGILASPTGCDVTGSGSMTSGDLKTRTYITVGG